jgi:phage head maturation protease
MSTATKIPTERRAVEVDVVGLELNATKTKMQGIAVPYNDPTDVGFFVESHLPGSFAKSIKEAARSLPLHVFHDDMAEFGNVGWPIGVASEWHDETDVLRVVWNLHDDQKSQRAAQLATPDEEGNAALGYFSIRFQPILSNWQLAEKWDPDLGSAYKDRVDRVESRLVSVALVSTPAFIRTPVEWVRSAPPPGRDTGQRKVDAWSRYLEDVKAGPR